MVAEGYHFFKDVYRTEKLVSNSPDPKLFYSGTRTAYSRTKLYHRSVHLGGFSKVRTTLQAMNQNGILLLK